MTLVEVFRIGSYWVVAQVDEFIVDLLGVVICGGESYVALVVEPDCEGVEVCGDYPLSDVEFSALDD